MRRHFAAQAALSLAWWRQRPGEGGDRRLTPDMATASGRMIVLGALLTALAIGFRTQNALLTLPLLAGVLLDRIGRGFAPAVFGSFVALAVGSLLWAVPLVVASGGVDAYLAALGVQAGEDFAGGEMLYLNPAPRLVAIALVRTFIYPWDSFVLGGVICGLAALGGVVLLLRDWRTFTAVVLVAVPYLVFHLLFQDTSYVRYALPLVAPVAFLAIRGVEGVAPRVALPVAALLTIWSVVIASPVAAAYGSESSPTAQAVAAMEQRRASEPPGALGMHQTYQRPLEAETLDVKTLASPPRREWLELARYWREGGTEPLWFLADPRRSDLALDRSAEPSRPLRLRVDVHVALPDWGNATGFGLVDSDAAAGLVRRGRLGAHTGNGGHGSARGPRSRHRADHRVDPPPARPGSPADRRPASRVVRGSGGAVHRGDR